MPIQPTPLLLKSKLFSSQELQELWDRKSSTFNNAGTMVLLDERQAYIKIIYGSGVTASDVWPEADVFSFLPSQDPSCFPG